ncbi:hypothetical protein WG909_09020 [Peptostreptococcaceae bacterium AGR-M142]
MKLLDDLKEIIYDFFGFIVPGFFTAIIIFIYYSSFKVNNNYTSVIMFHKGFDFKNTFETILKIDSSSLTIFIGLLICYLLGITVNILARVIFSLIKKFNLHHLLSVKYFLDYIRGDSKYINFKYLGGERITDTKENESLYRFLLRRKDSDSLIQKYIAKYNFFMNIKLVLLLIFFMNIFTWLFESDIFNFVFYPSKTLLIILLSVTLLYSVANACMVKYKKNNEKNSNGEEKYISKFDEWTLQALNDENRLKNLKSFLFLINYIILILLFIINKNSNQINNLRFFVFNISLYTFYLAMDFEHVRHYYLSKKETHLGMNYLEYINSKDKKND